MSDLLKKAIEMLVEHEVMKVSRGAGCSRLGCAFSGGGYTLHFNEPVIVCDRCVVEYHQTEQFESWSNSVGDAETAYYAAMAAVAGGGADKVAPVEASRKLQLMRRNAARAFRNWLAETPNPRADL